MAEESHLGIGIPRLGNRIRERFAASCARPFLPSQWLLLLESLSVEEGGQRNDLHDRE